ncbi:MAG: hypothetical protein ACSHX7_11285 [Luteolibacter sp.]
MARLEDLATRNPMVSETEIKALQDTLKETKQSLSEARVRLDSLRLIVLS